ERQGPAQVSRLDWELVSPIFYMQQRVLSDPEVSMLDVLTPPIRQQVLGPAPQRVVQLISKDRRLGIYILGDKMGGDPIDNQDNQILDVVVRQASIILENHLILEQNHQLHLQVLEAREDERKRVARDLHDQIIQALINMVFQVEEFYNTVKYDELAVLLDKLRDTLDQTRDICSDLRPAALDIFGLGPAIQTRISGFEEQYPCRIIYREKKNGPDTLPDETRLCLYRFFQEALINVQKHSQATQVFVILSYEPEQVSLTIRDNGKGFSIPSHLEELTREQHFGLVGIQELLNIIHGSLEIETSPGEGCLIKAIVPVDSQSLKKPNPELAQQII
ncbi:MAG: sensor histidine kinase, partial [Chloroflexi bacterium]|nr:sensor histidine kinase [Chloroflexota bacterium]